MEFTRLQLTGFKSFVDQTELVIEPGLTGVVGPNGCGKSNLVEALRWVMGESSARQMRGGEMDDVIFGGTSTRPSRNLAQVVLSMDNKARRAPTAINDADDLEITRQIARGQGSTYRVNGKEVRARDVQLLFADAASGAHSPSLVSQGRIGSLINAKPSDRRAILEDAAGIAGLHARRHEAELRLNAADTNLNRVDDVLATLDAQRQSLAKQVRQAARYRSVAEQIRKVEAMLLAVEWAEAERERAKGAEALIFADEVVTATAARAAAAATEQAEAAAALPGLRNAATEAGAAVQTLIQSAGELDAEARRIDQATRAVADRIEQLGRDTARENELGSDAETAIRRLDAEAAELGAVDGEAEQRQEAIAAVARAQADIEASEAVWTARSQTVAAEEARRAALLRRKGDLEQRLRRLSDDLARLDQERSRLVAGGDPADAIRAGEIAVTEASGAVETAQTALRQAQETRSKSAPLEAEALRALQAADGQLARLRGELAGVAASLAPQQKDLRSASPLIDQVTADPGYETALGAALGEDLLAPILAGSDSLGWAELPDDTATLLPEGVEALAAHVQAPAVLARRLRAIGVVADRAQAEAVWPLLSAGCRLVTKTGDLWRWDGFFRAAGAKQATAARLAQRNRLVELEQAKIKAEAERIALDQKLVEARQQSAAAQEAERLARAQEGVAVTTLNTLRARQAKLVSDAAQTRARLTALDEQRTRLSTDRAEVERDLADASGSGSDAIDLDAVKREGESARQALAQNRAVLAEARSRLDRLEREAEARTRRRQAIAQEAASWRQRAASTGERLADIARRLGEAEAERRDLAAQPAQLAERRRRVVEEIAQAEQARAAATDRLLKAEQQLQLCDTALRSAEKDFASAREERVRIETAQQMAIRLAQDVAERIRAKLDCRPHEIRVAAELAEDEVFPARDDLRTKLDRLTRERESIGAVNLRAETEAEAVNQQIATLEAEKNDLLQAIAKLRSAIAGLNKEGREKLLASFETVNGHFQDLFVRLFGGGRATLQLTETEDPLASGLEIMASPPGKKLQTLTLLSGGEQALTALALIFAVFLTNPSPICVLDEVDAPLDDANVDRFCNLLEDIARTTGTRFLVITHHRLTMTRMDRLFGVTMAERGISQLVSVDLARADRLRATA